MRKSACIFAALLALGTQAHAADITVPASTAYFSGWNFSFISPNGIAETIQMPAGQSLVGSLNGAALTWTVTSRPGTSAGVHTDGRNAFGLSLPVGTSAPISSGQGFLDRGVGDFSVPAPYPTGTTFFIQDVDNTEAADVRFYDCAGAVVDAGDFDFLLVSTTFTPNHSVLGAAPNRYWHVSSVVANDANTVNGIVIRSNSVCKIEVTATRNTNGGGINYFLGSPPNVVPTAIPAIAGTPEVGAVVTGTYSYADNELDAENATSGGTTYKFVTSPNPTIATSSDGTTVGSGSTGGVAGPVSYTLLPSDLNMYVYYCVTPVAATGATAGVEVCTAVAAGPVAAKPVTPATPVVPQAVPSLTGVSLAGLGGLMLLLGALRRKNAH